MKVFFIGDRRSAEYKSTYSKIIKKIEKLGHTVDKSHFETSSQEDELHPKKSYLKYMKSLKNTDLLVAEVTSLSSGIGFFISAALSNNKPVLALFNSDSETKPSKTLLGSNEKLMEFKKYTVASLDNELFSYFDIIKRKIDTKFILIISPEIDRYLEWASQENRMHKAQIVRDAVEKVIKKDKDYKKFLERA